MISPTSLVEELDKLSAWENGTTYETFYAILIRVESAEYITLAVGLLLMLVGVVGCIGTATNSKCLLKTFIAISVVLILGQCNNRKVYVLKSHCWEHKETYMF